MARRKSNSSTRKGSSSPVDLLRSIGQTSTARRLNLSGSADFTRLAVGAQSIAKPLSFGSPSNKGAKGSTKTSTGTLWTSLLGSTSSNGMSDLLGGGGLLSTGLDYLTGGIASLFGAGSESVAEPLTQFVLPHAQDQTINTRGRQVNDRANAANLYGQPAQLSATSKSAIIQTVKNAILTSSSLNDVIGEL
jgi:hypothetical protein